MGMMHPQGPVRVLVFLRPDTRYLSEDEDRLDPEPAHRH